MNAKGYSENLIPFNAMSKDQHLAISSRGGKASGAARRAKREMINLAKVNLIAEKELNSTIASFLTRGLPQMGSRFGG